MHVTISGCDITVQSFVTRSKLKCVFPNLRFSYYFPLRMGIFLDASTVFIVNRKFSTTTKLVQ